MPKAPLFALTSPDPVYTENDIEDQAKTYWRRKGWTVIRNHVGTFKARSGHTVKIGEKGQCDYLVLKPIRAGVTLAVYCEIKRPGERPNPEQLEWMNLASVGGFACVWFDDGLKLARWFDRLEADAA
jgi:hypothetical protein